MAAENFDGLEANAGSGGAFFAMDEFTDASGNTRRMPLSSIVIVDGAGYSRVGAANPLPVTGPLTDVQLRATAVPVSAASLPLPSGASTAAKQPALGVAGTASADVLSVQGIASGTNLNVSIAAFGAGVSNGGELTCHLGSEVFEDAVASDGQSLMAIAGVRRDTPASSSGASGDWGTLNFDASGCLWVNVNASVLPTGAASAANQVTELASLASIDNKTPTPSAIAGDNVAAPSAPNAYSFGMVYDGANWDRMPGTSVNGMLVNLGANNGVDTELPAAAALADGAANPTAPAVGSCIEIFNGTTWDRARGDTTNGLDVDVTRLPALVAGTAIIGKVTTDQTTHGTTDLVAADITKVAGTAIAQGHGTAAAAIRVELPTDGTGVVILGAGTAIVGKFGIDQTTPGTTNLVQGAELLVDDTPFTPATSKVSPIGLQADETAPDSVDEGDIGCPRMTLDRKQIVTSRPHTSGGQDAYSFLSTAAVQAAAIKASPGQVYELSFTNKNASPVYVRLYNQTGSPATTDAANIKWRFQVPGNTSVGGYIERFEGGLEFSAGIGIRVTAGVADNDATVLSANDVMGNVGFK